MNCGYLSGVPVYADRRLAYDALRFETYDHKQVTLTLGQGVLYGILRTLREHPGRTERIFAHPIAIWGLRRGLDLHWSEIKLSSLLAAAPEHMFGAS